MILQQPSKQQQCIDHTLNPQKIDWLSYGREHSVYKPSQCQMTMFTINVSFFSWNWLIAMYIWSALWILVAWCFSTRASEATVLSIWLGISICLWVNFKLFLISYFHISFNQQYVSIGFSNEPYVTSGKLKSTDSCGLCREWVSEWLSLTAFLEQRTARSI